MLAGAIVALSACSGTADAERARGASTTDTDVSATTPHEAAVETTEPAPTTTEPPLDVYDPLCVVQVAPGSRSA